MITKKLSLLFFFIIFIFLGCKNNDESSSSIYYTYRDIPGISSEEIDAIEELKNSRDFFTYGMIPSTEAFLSVNGEIRGFSALLCEWLSDLFNIPFIPSLFNTEDFFEGLREGSIDFTGHLHSNGEYIDTYLMTSTIARRSVEYIRLESSLPLSEISLYRLPRYAFLDGGSVLYNTIPRIAHEFELFLVSNYLDAYELLKNGEIDALIAEGIDAIIFDIYDDVVTSTFLPLSYSTVSLTTQNSELMPIISVMQKALENNAIRHLNALYQQGLTEYNRNRFFLHLTREELNFLQNNRVIPFVAEFDNYPLSFFNARESQWQGISFDVLDEIEALTGMEFLLINDEQTEFPELLRMLEEGEAQIISELIYSADREGHFLWPSTAFFTDQSVLISKMEHPYISINEIMYERVGLNRATVHTELFQRWFPDHQYTVEYDGQDEIFEALTNGEVDLVMSSGYRLLSLTNYRELSGYKINILFDNSLQSSFGINKDADILLSIMNKALDLVDIQTISGLWLRRTFDYRLRMAEARVPLSIGTAIALALIIFFLTSLYLRDRKKRKVISEQAAVLNAVYNSIPVMVYTKDKNNLYTSSNKKFLEDFNISESELIGKSFKDLKLVEDNIAEEFSRLDEKILNEGNTVTNEDWYNYPDGTRRAREITRTPLILNSRIVGLLGVASDITNRKLIEESANKLYEHAMLMLDSTPLCIQIWDRELNTIDCNEEAVRLYGFKNKQEYIERFITDCSPKYQSDGQESSEKAVYYVNKAFTEGKCVFDWMHQLPDGTPMPAEVTLVRVTYKGDFLVIGYTQDLRDFTRLEAQAYGYEYAKKLSRTLSNITMSTTISAGYLKEAAHLIALDACKVLNVTRVGIWSLSESGHTLMNICCYDAGENKYFVQDDFDLSNRHEYVKILESERLIVTDDISTSPLLSDYNKVYAPESCALIDVPIRIDGKLAGVVCIEQDRCTEFPIKREWRLVEQNFASSLADLMALAISSSERRIAREDAEKANRAKSAFLASMSHEIRTPMNAIIGMSELLLSQSGNSNINHIRDIHISAIALLNIINDILDFSKIQSGRLDLVPIHFDFLMFLENINSMTQFLLRGKKVSYIQEVTGELPKYLYGSDLRLRQIIINLLGNAVKFTDEGYVKLHISSLNEELVFEISDTGIGINEKDIPLLFDPFTQFDALKNRTKEGTGLGLSITKSLVDSMEGEISVDSVYGQGTVFRVRIPMIRGDENLIQKTSLTEISISAPDAKVLVVDDNTINLNVATGLLGQCNIKAETAGSGREAIELIKKNHYDLVFMDHMMPELNGVETTKLLRKEGITVPVIAFTANAISDVKDEFLAAGMNDLLIKPIKKDWFNKVMIDWLPKDKLIIKQNTEKVENTEKSEFFEKLAKIKELSLSEGLEHVMGQRDVYEKSLRLMIKEIDRCTNSLNTHLASGDMNNFKIEVHSMKGSLANIGAKEIASHAYELESAAENNDTNYCSSKLPAFLEELSLLESNLIEALGKTENAAKTELSTKQKEELSLVFSKLRTAFKENNFSAIDYEIKELELLNSEGSLKLEIEKIKDAVLIMDYNSAIKTIEEIV